MIPNLKSGDKLRSAIFPTSTSIWTVSDVKEYDGLQFFKGNPEGYWISTENYKRAE